MAKSIPDQLSMFEPTICEGSPSAISSLASAAGLTLCERRDGTITVQPGPGLAPASPSLSPEPSEALPTNATSGQSGEIWLKSFDLQSSLENRLRAQLNGSDLCEVTWKKWATPWGHSRYKPRARVRTTFGTDTGSWPTPTTRDYKDGGYCPNVPVNGLLGRMVWPTPTACADKSIRTPEGALAEIQRGRSPDLAAHAMWQTPVADDAVDRAKGKVNSRGDPKLSGQAIQSSTWSTPRASPNENRTTKATPSQMEGKHGQYLAVQAITSNGSSVPTGKPGALNPEFVCWLMGYPTEWVSCGVSVTRSTTGRRKNSSPRT
jgi:hypothetical protein